MPAAPATDSPAPAGRAADAPRSAQGPDQPRLPWWPALLAAVLTGLIGFWGMGGPELWYDEAATVSAVDRPLGSLLRMLQSVDLVHGLYYLLMMPWATVFGTSPVALRAPSTLVLMAMAALLTRLAMAYARRWMPDRMLLAGVSTAVLAATLPGLTWAAQEARGYAFCAAAAVGGLWCFEKWLETRRWWLLAGLVVLQIAAVLFALFAIMLLPLYLVRLLPRLHLLGPGSAHPPLRRGQVLQAAGAGLLVVAAAVPFALAASAQSAQVGWISVTIPEMLLRMSRQLAISPVNRPADMVQIANLLAVPLALILLAAVVVGLTLCRARAMVAWLTAAVLLPVAVVTIAQLAGQEFYQERYFIYTVPLVILAVSLGLAAVPWPALGTGALGVLVGLSAVSLVAQNAWDAKADNNYGRAAHLIEQRADTAVFVEDFSRGPLIAYPPSRPIADPMLERGRVASDSLWGQVRKPWEAETLDYRGMGRVVVVDEPPSPSLPHIVRTMEQAGCRVDPAPDRSTRFRLTFATCP